jgi:2,3-dihydroxyphenylpropionate 1,2-dioxygenase
MSHSPLLDLGDHPAELTTDVGGALARARDFVREYDPDLVVLFTPDHYNGFFYRLMPPFCIGLQASGVGDYGTAAGPLNVPREVAEDLASAVLDAGVDVCVSVQMDVDHGAVQPLEKLFGGIDTVPVVPVFVNSVAAPLGPMRRVRLLGEAVGRHLAGRPERVLVLGSGGLSHDPPVPTLATATGPVAERIVTGRPATADERAARQEAVIAAGAGFAAGTTPLQPLNPDWSAAGLLVQLLGRGTGRRLGPRDPHLGRRPRRDGRRRRLRDHLALLPGGPGVHRRVRAHHGGGDRGHRRILTVRDVHLRSNDARFRIEGRPCAGPVHPGGSGVGGQRGGLRAPHRQVQRPRPARHP